jgi:hypothetical protein
MVQKVLRWYIGQCELRSLKYGAKHPQLVHWEIWATQFKYVAKNFLAHIAQYTTWGRFAPYFKLLSSHCPMYQLRTLCTIFKLLSSPRPKCELRSLIYGAKRAQMIHWAMWAKKFKIWCKESSDGTLDKLLSAPCPMYHVRTLCTIF